jgi:hypothetical protein
MEWQDPSHGTACSNSTRSQSRRPSISRHFALAFALCVRFSQRYKLPYHSRCTFSLVCRRPTNLECSQSKLVGEASPCCTCLQLLYRHLVPSSTPDRAATRASSSIDEETAHCSIKLKTSLLSPAFSHRQSPSLSCRRESSNSTRSHSAGSELGRPPPDLEHIVDSMLDALLLTEQQALNIRR